MAKASLQKGADAVLVGLNSSSYYFPMQPVVSQLRCPNLHVLPEPPQRSLRRGLPHATLISRKKYALFDFTAVSQPESLREIQQ